MDMKYMQIFNQIMQEFLQLLLYYNSLQKKGELIMMKFLAKIAEKYAKATNTACLAYWWGHQPKMPASLIKKD